LVFLGFRVDGRYTFIGLRLSSATAKQMHKAVFPLRLNTYITVRC